MPEPARVYIVDPGSWEDGSELARDQELQPGDVLRIYGRVTRIEFEAADGAEQWRGVGMAAEAALENHSEGVIYPVRDEG